MCPLDRASASRRVPSMRAEDVCSRARAEEPRPQRCSDREAFREFEAGHKSPPRPSPSGHVDAVGPRPAQARLLAVSDVAADGRRRRPFHPAPNSGGHGARFHARKIASPPGREGRQVIHHLRRAGRCRVSEVYPGREEPVARQGQPRNGKTAEVSVSPVVPSSVSIPTA